MTDQAIPGVEFHQVGKKFMRGTYHDTFRDLIASRFRRIWDRGSGGREEDGEFWALQDVSFQVEPGEVLGIIGPNGAGKSTILKLIAGILEPDRGRVEVRGRVGALIELAAGFHSELTGAENVYMQGAIMGMSRDEVSRRFEEIIEFAGVRDFVDTPVKRYSSGMRVRLGFSIAAHTDPKILVVDEVLRVGDLEFQQKATDRLRKIVRRDIPVIIVSHQLDRVTELCDRGILVAGGRVCTEGSAEECVDDYVAGRHLEGEGGSSPPVRVLGIEHRGTGRVRSGETVDFRIRGVVDGDREPAVACVGVRVRAMPSLETLFASNNVDCGVDLPTAGSFEIDISLRVNLGQGLYRIESVVWDREDGLEWTRGPTELLEVDRSAEIRGRVNLEPRMNLVRS